MYGLKTANLTNNTIYKLIKQIKSFLFWALERNYLNNIDFKRVKTKEENTEFIYLTEFELLKILNMDLSENQRLSNVRDVFCLSCFTAARFSDISNLKLSDIKNGTWLLRTQKTKDILEIPLNDYAINILDKYIQSEKSLPVISNQKSNEYLKELCKLAEIDEPTRIVKYKGAERIEIVKPKYELVSTHTARRTFITLSLEKGMKPEIVMEITGHKEYKTMKKYIIITSRVKHNEMMNVWKKVE
jgi:integrase